MESSFYSFDSKSQSIYHSPVENSTRENIILYQNKIPKDLDLTLGTKLGSGSAGTVSLYKDQYGKLYAVKKLDFTTEKNIMKVGRELIPTKILKCKHKNISCVISTIIKDDHVLLVYDYYENSMTLYDYILKNETLSDDELLNIFYQLLDGLAYMHSKNIIHRDIKPQNIIMTEDLRPIYIDFDLSCDEVCSYFKCEKILMGSPNYVAPELWARNFENLKASDVYALGVVFYFMANKRLPYEAKTMKELKEKVLKVDPKASTYEIEGINSLIMAMICKDPKERLSAEKYKKFIEAIIYFVKST